MKILNRSFFFGCGSAWLFIILIVVLGLVFGKGYIKAYGVKQIRNNLAAPFMPALPPAYYDWSVDTLDGQKLAMAETKGQTVFLSFWNPSCWACLAQMQSVQRLYEQVADAGIRFVCVAVEGEPEEILQEAEEQGLTFPVYRYTDPRPDAYVTNGVPSTFILTPDGHVAMRQVGGAKWDEPNVVSYLRGLAALSAAEGATAAAASGVPAG
ncbi:MAG: TlpA family protein disulfide reductase [Candidatus Hydrogenedentes bacterium]|nr:TlpA family protein disulfide reductase [Candidatus Hydrogenedentota bacterium]